MTNQKQLISADLEVSSCKNFFGFLKVFAEIVK